MKTPLPEFTIYKLGAWSYNTKQEKKLRDSIFENLLKSTGL